MWKIVKNCNFHPPEFHLEWKAFEKRETSCQPTPRSIAQITYPSMYNLKRMYKHKYRTLPVLHCVLISLETPNDVQSVAQDS